MPLVIKVRFVASTLLDALNGPSGGSEQSLPVSLKTQRAQTYLCPYCKSHLSSGFILMVPLRGFLEDIERDRGFICNDG